MVASFTFTGVYMRINDENEDIDADNILFVQLCAFSGMEASNFITLTLTLTSKRVKYLLPRAPATRMRSPVWDRLLFQDLKSHDCVLMIPSSAPTPVLFQVSEEFEP